MAIDHRSMQCLCVWVINNIVFVLCRYVVAIGHRSMQCLCVWVINNIVFCLVQVRCGYRSQKHAVFVCMGDK